MRTCVVPPPGECLQVQAHTVLFAGNTVWSISKCIRWIRKDELYEIDVTFTLEFNEQLTW